MNVSLSELKKKPQLEKYLLQFSAIDSRRIFICSHETQYTVHYGRRAIEYAVNMNLRVSGNSSLMPSTQSLTGAFNDFA